MATVRGVPAANGRPWVPGKVIPRAATQHTVRARWGPCWINNVARRINCIPVLAPLPHISVHIIQPPGIGRKTLHRCRRIYW
jgi:hypothetical protein